MARPLRIEFAGALYHVTARENERRSIFFSDDDRSRFLDTLGEVCARFSWRCHAFCQMTNHYHLLVETPEANLCSTKEISAHFGVGRMTVSRAVQRLETALRQEQRNGQWET